MFTRGLYPRIDKIYVTYKIHTFTDLSSDPETTLSSRVNTADVTLL